MSFFDEEPPKPKKDPKPEYTAKQPKADEGEEG